MSAIALPKSSKPIVIFAIALLITAFLAIATAGAAYLWLVLPAFFLSGFLADLFTGVMHFGFDYVFPDEMPILGPISVEFRQHHSRPTLDPSNYVENLTKGAYGSIVLSVIVLYLAETTKYDAVSFLATATLFGMSLWGLFFHQIHSYAHMGALLGPEVFNDRVAQISSLPEKRQQIRAFDALFEDVPIPRLIRRLQNWRILLNPGVHNLHHLDFESDFSSVNGWSDPVMNLLWGPLSRHFKAKRALEALSSEARS
jgi:hypothetical protein